jgi:hypothetical protein
MDINDPRNTDSPNRIHPDLPPGMTTKEDSSTYWPIVVVIAALVAGMFFFGNNRTDQPNTQVGQNVERPATTIPSTTPRQQ